MGITQPSDAELLARLRNGDSAAFAVLRGRYAHTVPRRAADGSSVKPVPLDEVPEGLRGEPPVGADDAACEVVLDAYVGLGERALEAMCRRLVSRHAFGRAVSEHSVWRERIAHSRCLLDQARLMVMKAARMMDTVGNKAARAEIAMIKVIAPQAAEQVIDWAVQAHGAAGVSQDSFLAKAWAHTRSLRLADGPDEVHREAIARFELKKHSTEAH